MEFQFSSIIIYCKAIIQYLSQNTGIDIAKVQNNSIMTLNHVSLSQLNQLIFHLCSISLSSWQPLKRLTPYKMNLSFQKCCINEITNLKRYIQPQCLQQHYLQLRYGSNLLLLLLLSHVSRVLLCVTPQMAIT